MLYFGCTHYPLVQEEIKEVLGKDVIFFNGAPYLAKHLKEVLQEKNLLEIQEGNVEFIDSQNLIIKRKRFYKILGDDFYEKI